MPQDLSGLPQLDPQAVPVVAHGHFPNWQWAHQGNTVSLEPIGNGIATVLQKGQQQSDNEDRADFEQFMVQHGRRFGEERERQSADVRAGRIGKYDTWAWAAMYDTEDGAATANEYRLKLNGFMDQASRAVSDDGHQATFPNPSPFQDQAFQSVANSGALKTVYGRAEFQRQREKIDQEFQNGAIHRYNLGKTDHMNALLESRAFGLLTDYGAALRGQTQSATTTAMLQAAGIDISGLQKQSAQGALMAGWKSLQKAAFQNNETDIRKIAKSALMGFIESERDPIVAAQVLSLVPSLPLGGAKAGNDPEVMTAVGRARDAIDREVRQAFTESRVQRKDRIEQAASDFLTRRGQDGVSRLDALRGAISSGQDIGPTRKMFEQSANQELDPESAEKAKEQIEAHIRSLRETRTAESALETDRLRAAMRTRDISSDLANPDTIALVGKDYDKLVEENSAVGRARMAARDNGLETSKKKLDGLSRQRVLFSSQRDPFVEDHRRAMVEMAQDNMEEAMLSDVESIMGDNASGDQKKQSKLIRDAVAKRESEATSWLNEKLSKYETDRAEFFGEWNRRLERRLPVSDLLERANAYLDTNSFEFGQKREEIARKASPLSSIDEKMYQSLIEEGLRKRLENDIKATPGSNALGGRPAAIIPPEQLKAAMDSWRAKATTKIMELRKSDSTPAHLLVAGEESIANDAKDEVLKAGDEVKTESKDQKLTMDQLNNAMNGASSGTEQGQVNARIHSQPPARIRELMAPIVEQTAKGAPTPGIGKAWQLYADFLRDPQAPSKSGIFREYLTRKVAETLDEEQREAVFGMSATRFPDAQYWLGNLMGAVGIPAQNVLGGFVDIDARSDLDRPAMKAFPTGIDRLLSTRFFRGSGRPLDSYIRLDLTNPNPDTWMILGSDEELTNVAKHLGRDPQQFITHQKLLRRRYQ